jgi:hypothetical protein
LTPRIFKTSLVLPVCLATGLTSLPAQRGVEFEAPVRMRADGEYVKVEAPGYAAPSWADVDGDGKKDLLVGQFNKGKIKVYRNLGGGKLAAGEWLQAGGDIAEVPGVW